MKVKVKFFAALREITGSKEEEIEIDRGASVEILLTKLAEKYGERFRKYVYDEKARVFKSYLQFLVDGKSIHTLKGFETKLDEGSSFAIIPPVGGGILSRWLSNGE